MDTVAPITLTHVELITLSRHNLYSLLRDFPATKKRIQFAARFYRWRISVSLSCSMHHAQRAKNFIAHLVCIQKVLRKVREDVDRKRELGVKHMSSSFLGITTNMRNLSLVRQTMEKASRPPFIIRNSAPAKALFCAFYREDEEVGRRHTARGGDGRREEAWISHARRQPPGEYRGPSSKTGRQRYGWAVFVWPSDPTTYALRHWLVPDAQLDGLEQRFGTFEEKTDAQFKGLEQRFGKFEEKLDELLQRSSPGEVQGLRAVEGP